MEDSQIKAEKLKLISDINNDNQSIDVWNKYLKWAIKHFNTEKYRELLQKFISHFNDLDIYKNDPRYVNAWLHLAETDGDDATFKYMENNGIGNKCASFYSAWANLYEKSGKMQIPIQIYNQGEECMAEPKELFSKLKSSFYKRLQEKESLAELQNLQTISPRSPLLPLDFQKELKAKQGKANRIETLAYNSESDVFTNIEPNNKDYHENKENQINNIEVNQLKEHVKQELTFGFNKMVETFLADETDIKQESAVHKSITEFYGDGNQNNFLHYPVNKVYSKHGQFSLEEIWAARYNRKKIISRKDFFERKHLQEKEKLVKTIEKREKQIHHLLSLLKTKNENVDIEEPEFSNNDLTVLIRSTYDQLHQQQSKDLQSSVDASSNTANSSSSNHNFSKSCQLSPKKYEGKLQELTPNPQSKPLDPEEKENIFCNDRLNSCTAKENEEVENIFSTLQEKSTRAQKIGVHNNVDIDAEIEPNVLGDVAVSTGHFFSDIIEPLENDLFISCNEWEKNDNIFSMDIKPGNNIVSTDSTTNKTNCSENEMKQEQTCHDVNADSTCDKKLSPIFETRNESDKSKNCERDNDSAILNKSTFVYSSSAKNEIVKEFEKMPFETLQKCLDYSNESNATQGDNKSLVSEFSKESLFDADTSAMKEMPLEKNFSDLSIPEKLNIVDDPWEDSVLEELLSNKNCRLENVIQYNDKMPALKKGMTIDLGNDNICTVFGLHVKGGFAKVFKAVNYETKKEFALKVQQPPFPWEIYINQETKRRFNKEGLGVFANQIMDICGTVLYTNSSLIVSDLLSGGTLLDLVKQNAESAKKLFPIYYDFTCDIMNLVHALHSVGIMHGDIKPDNFLVFQSNSQMKLKLIDFGRAIDLRAMPSNTAFLKSCGTSGFVCPQMQLEKPWNYHIDYFGIAGTVHVMLCNSYMKIYQDKNGVWNASRKRPRWSSENYDVLFSSLLNFKTPDDNWCPTFEDSPLPSLLKLFINNK